MGRTALCAASASRLGGSQQAEIEECRRHEALLNLAFADAENFWLRCPYDRSTLEPTVVADACGTHPEVSEGGASRRSESYPAEGGVPMPFTGELSAPGRDAAELRFAASELKAVREFAVRTRAPPVSTGSGVSDWLWL